MLALVPHSPTPTIYTVWDLLFVLVVAIISIESGIRFYDSIQNRASHATSIQKDGQLTGIQKDGQ